MQLPSLISHSLTLIPRSTGRTFCIPLLLPTGSNDNEQKQNGSSPRFHEFIKVSFDCPARTERLQFGGRISLLEAATIHVVRGQLLSLL